MENELPIDTVAAAVTVKSDERLLLIPVQTIDGRMQTAFRIDIAILRKRIIDVRGPVLFLKDGEYPFLIRGRDAKLLDCLVTHSQRAAILIPDNLRLSR